jgi:cytoskeleton protein RodZ
MADSLDSSQPSASGVPSIGAPGELVGVREQRGWSQADVAQRLKLRVRQLDALERGDWEALPGRAFIRGTLRSYARLLEVDIDPLLKVVGGFAQAEELRPSASLGTQLPRSGGFGFDSDTRSNRLPWALLGVLGVIALAVFFGRDGEMVNPSQWFGVPPAVTPSGSAKPAAAGASLPSDSPVDSRSDSSGVTGATAVPSDSGAAPALVVPGSKLANGDPTLGVTGAGLAQASGSSTSSPVSSVSPGTTGASGASGAASGTPGAASAEPVRPPSTLRLTVRQDAWIEIRQADGQTVFSAIVKPGSPVDIDAKKPVSIVIGNANQVSLEFEGKPFDLKPQTVMPNNIAKVKLP